MKKSFFPFLVSVVLIGCASQTVPPVPDQAMAASSRVKLATLTRGHQVYMSECTRCHEAWFPAEISGDDWHVVVPGMAWNANISSSDEEALLAYLLAAREETP